MFSNEVIWAFSIGVFVGAFASNKPFREYVMRLINRKPKQESAPTKKPAEADSKGGYDIVEETTVTRKYQPKQKP